jgi:putative addiction module component (TIGR02574 family)
MSEALQQLIPRIKRLSFQDRAELADFLHASLSAKERKAVEKAWEAEADRRFKEIKRGRAKGRRAEDVLEDLRKKYQ